MATKDIISLYSLLIMTERVVFVRHFKDHDNLFLNFDSPIMESELEKAETIANDILLRAKEGEFDHIHFIVSNKIRTELTARETARRLERFAKVSIEVDSRI